MSNAQGFDYVAIKYVQEPAVEESKNGKCGAPTAGGAIIRGELCLRANGGLLDISGRKVMELRAGANDVRALAPGVYFVQQKDSRRQGSGDSRVTKAVATR
jgi:hypothetical protein